MATRAPRIIGRGRILRTLPVVIRVPPQLVRFDSYEPAQDLMVTIRQQTHLKVTGVAAAIAALKPAPVTAFNAVATSQTVVDLSWVLPVIPGGALTSLELNRRTLPAGAFGANLLTGIVTTYHDVAKVAATGYEYRIRTVSGTSFGDYVFDTVTTPPTQTTGIVVSNYAHGPPWPSGIGDINLPSGYTSWKNWSGREPDIFVAWSAPPSMTNWTEFRTGGGPKYTQALQTFPITTTIIHSYPMLPGDHSTANFQHPEYWDQAANGDFDANYQTAFQNMRARAITAGRPANDLRIGLRLGWEMNGSWYAWSIHTAKLAEFKETWRRIVAIARVQFPGMIVDFSPARNFGGNNRTLTLEQMLPASADYDVISRSLHDDQPSTTTTNNGWQLHYNPAPSTKTFGLLDVVNSCVAHNKRMAYSEWSTNMVDCDANHPQSTEPHTFLQRVYDFFYDNRALMAWDAYFSSSCCALQTRTGTQAAQVYDSNWNVP